MAAESTRSPNRSPSHAGAILREIVLPGAEESRYMAGEVTAIEPIERSISPGGSEAP